MPRLNSIEIKKVGFSALPDKLMTQRLIGSGIIPPEMFTSAGDISIPEISIDEEEAKEDIAKEEMQRLSKIMAIGNVIGGVTEEEPEIDEFFEEPTQKEITERIVEKIIEKNIVSQEKIEQIVQNFILQEQTQNKIHITNEQQDTIVQNIFQNIQPEATKQIFTNYISSVVQPEIIREIVSESLASAPQLPTVVTEMPEISETIIPTVPEQERHVQQIKEEIIKEITGETIVESIEKQISTEATETIVEKLIEKNIISQEQMQNIVQNIIQQNITTENIFQNIQPEQIEQIVQNFISITMQPEIIREIVLESLIDAPHLPIFATGEPVRTIEGLPAQEERKALLEPLKAKSEAIPEKPVTVGEIEKIDTDGAPLIWENPILQNLVGGVGETEINATEDTFGNYGDIILNEILENHSVAHGDIIFNEQNVENINQFISGETTVRETMNNFLEKQIPDSAPIGIVEEKTQEQAQLLQTINEIINKSTTVHNVNNITAIQEIINKFTDINMSNDNVQNIINLLSENNVENINEFLNSTEFSSIKNENILQILSDRTILNNNAIFNSFIGSNVEFIPESKEIPTYTKDINESISSGFGNVNEIYQKAVTDRREEIKNIVQRIFEPIGIVSPKEEIETYYPEEKEETSSTITYEDFKEDVQQYSPDISETIIKKQYDNYLLRQETIQTINEKIEPAEIQARGDELRNEYERENNQTNINILELIQSEEFKYLLKKYVLFNYKTSEEVEEAIDDKINKYNKALGLDLDGKL